MVNKVTDIQPKKFTKTDQNEKAIRTYRDVAQGIESQFINHLLGEMRKTINKDDPDSSEMDYYRSLMDNEYAQIMTKQNDGIGIQKIILDQILPEHLKDRNPSKKLGIKTYEVSKKLHEDTQRQPHVELNRQKE